MLKRANFRLTVLCGILIALNLCIQETQGLKCYFCEKCSEPKNELECTQAKPACYLTEAKNGDKHRGCEHAHQEAEDAQTGIKCDSWFTSPHDETYRRCYCDTDLCNDNSILGKTPSGSGLAKGRYHIFIAIFLIATVYQGKVIN